MTLLGNHERISAARALEIGLVTEVVPLAELPAAAQRIAAAIASQPPTAVQASLRSLWAARELTRAQMLDVGNTFLNLAMSKDALAEGQAGVHAPASASTPRSGDARRHRPRGGAGASGPGRRSSTPTARACPTPTSTGAPTRWRPACSPPGIGPGDVVLLRLPSDSAYVVAYAAAAKVGAITAGVNPRLAPPEQEAVAEVAGGALTLAIGRRGRGAAAARPACRRSPTTPTGRSPSCSPRAPPASRRGRCSATGSSPPSPASTSPTPGAIPPAAPTPMLAGTQFAHVGFMTKLPWYLRLGTTTHILGRWRAADALACIAEHRIAVARRRGPADRAAAPRGPRGLRPRPACRPSIVGGAASPPALVREAKARFDADVLHPLLLHRERRLRHRHRVRRRRRGGAVHRRPAARRHRGGHLRRRRRARSPTARWARCGCAPPPRWPSTGATRRRTAHALVRGLAAHRRPRAASTSAGCLRLAGRLKEMFIRGGLQRVPGRGGGRAGRPPAGGRGGRRPPARRRDGRDRRGRGGARRPDRPARPSTTSAPSSSPSWPATSCPRRSAIVDELPLTPMQKVDRRALAAQESPPTPERCHPVAWWAGTGATHRGTCRRRHAVAAPTGRRWPLPVLGARAPRRRGRRRRAAARRRRRGPVAATTVALAADADADRRVHARVARGPRRPRAGGRPPGRHRPPTTRSSTALVDGRRRRRDAPRREHHRRGAGRGAGRRACGTGSAHDLLVAVDDEGGRVSSMGALDQPVTSARRLGQRGEEAAEEAGEELGELARVRSTSTGCSPRWPTSTTARRRASSATGRSAPTPTRWPTTAGAFARGLRAAGRGRHRQALPRPRRRGRPPPRRHRRRHARSTSSRPRTSCRSGR